MNIRKIISVRCITDTPHVKGYPQSKHAQFTEKVAFFTPWYASILTPW